MRVGRPSYSGHFSAVAGRDFGDGYTKAKEAASAGGATGEEAPDPDAAPISTEQEGKGELAGVATEGKGTAD